MVGQLPGTIGYVSTGAGFNVLSSSPLDPAALLASPSAPLFVAGGVALFGLLKVAGDVAGKAIKEIEREEGGGEEEVVVEEDGK